MTWIPVDMLSGVILAGGKGSRMGGEKGLVKVGDRPMLLHVIRALSGVTDDIVVAVGRDCGPTYERSLGPGVRTVEDRVSGRGPLEGLSNAFREVEQAYVAVVPCDVPLLRTEILELLARRAAGRDGAVPVVGGFLEPLVAVYRREAGLRRFAAELETGVGKVSNALEHMDICRVEEEELREVDGRLLSFWNVNSKEDLEKAEETIRQGAIPP